MILFAFEAYQPMAGALEKATGMPSGRFRAERFQNGELHICLQTPVENEDCFVLGSVAPPDEQLFWALLLAHTLKKERASRVTAIFPYLAYARDDKDKPGESLATAWAGALVKASGIDQVITVDVHSERARQLFPVPMVSISPAGVFAGALHRYALEDAIFVAPDEGALVRCQAVKTAAGLGEGNIAYFKKHRSATGITQIGPIGEVGRRAVMIDDILDTGGTLVSACEKLSEAGVEDISVMVTHGLFTGDRWRKLWQLGVTRILCTDSVPLPPGIDGKGIVRLSVAPLIERELCLLAKA